MFLSGLTIRNVRNITNSTIVADKGINVLIGENAAGKTTFLESIDILSRGRSFRTNRVADLVLKGSDGLYVGGVVGDEKTKLEIKKGGGGTKIFLNGREAKKQSEITEKIAVQCIHPASHLIIDGPPSERRSFVDWGLFHVEPPYKVSWTAYSKALKQRNEALKRAPSEADAWEDKLVSEGNVIDEMRKEYVKKVRNHFELIRPQILPEIPLSMEYQQGWPEEISLSEAIKKTKKTDQERGSTQYGPHHADLALRINGEDAQRIISRGQQKILANIMLIAQAKDFYDKRQDPSIILVDELSAELTLEMQEKVLERLIETGSQIFISALYDSILADILSETGAKMFHVEHGEIAE